MSFYRLIKPDWAKPKLANDEVNPKFIEEIVGPDVIEGYNFTQEFLTQENQKGYNLYFFPNHPSKDVYSDGIRHLSGKHIDVFNFVYIDMDLKDKVYASKDAFLAKLAEFPVRPTMVVNSGNGIHAYWQVSDLTRDSFVITNLALINHFNTDQSVFTVLQLMRLPGFLNTKRHKDYSPAEVLNDHSSGEIYTLSSFPESLYQMPETLVAKGQRHLDKLDGKFKTDLPDDVNLEELPDTFIDFIEDPKNLATYNLFKDPEGTYGDRSRADMKLANVLFKAGFNRKEALCVLSNTKKALSKGPYRYSYAEATVSKVYTDKLNSSKFMTVGQRNRTVDEDRNLGTLVKSTWYFDTSVLGNPWRKRELTGLIAGTGVGKTTITLKWMKDAIENNPETDDIYVFFSLEMSVGEIVTRWNKLVGKDSPLADRLYVIGNESETFDPRNIGLQEILEDCNELKKLTGKNIGMLAMDHVGIISRHIDTRKKYTFGIDSEMNAGYGNVRTLSLNSLCNQLKVLCKMLDTHVVVLTQTTKEKGVGDLPIDKDGAYGISNYENIMDRIITIWQPLKLVQHQTKTNFLAWQYVKIRNKHIEDKIATNEAKLLTFDLQSGDLRVTTTEEYETFQQLLPKATELRDSLIKKKHNNYSIQITLDKIRQDVSKLQQNKGTNNVGQVQPN